MARRRPDPRQARRGPPPGRAGHAQRGGGRGAPAVHDLPLGPEAPQPPDDGAASRPPGAIRSPTRYNHGALVSLLAGADGDARRPTAGRLASRSSTSTTSRCSTTTRGTGRRQRADDGARRARRGLPARGHHRPLRPRRVPGHRAAGRPSRASSRRSRRSATALVERSLDVYAGERIPITISAGIATYPEDGASLTVLLATVAATLGSAKGSGGDTDPRHRRGRHRGRRRRDVRRPAGPGLRGRHEGPLHEAALRGRRPLRGLPRAPDGLDEATIGDDPARRPAARHRQDRHPRSPPAQAGRADRRRVRDREAARRPRRPDRARPAGHRPHPRRHPPPPRALGRHGLPRRPGRRGHPAHRPDRGGRATASRR